MARYILIGVFLGAGILVGTLSYFGRQRGSWHLETDHQPEQAHSANRLGYLAMLPQGEPRVWTGVLLDAGCPMRDAFSPDTPAIRVMPGVPEAAGRRTGAGAAQTPAPERPPAVTQAPPGSIAAQRADVMQQQVPDVAARQMSMECAVTGVTRGFDIRLADGTLKRFDEGGNTKAIDAFQGTALGQAVLSGQAPGAKPRAEVIGHEQGDRIMVERIRLL